MDKININFTVNDRKVNRKVFVGARLLDVLRYDCDIPGTKEGCGKGECSACTV
jgi:carbon-monoxide dehydrogenase small subunit